MAKRRGGGESDLIKAIKAGDIVKCRRLLLRLEEKGVDNRIYSDI